MNGTIALGVTICLLTWASSAYTAEQEFLTPDEAFAITATGPSQADSIRVVWHIADGYYLYRSKFRFQTDTSGVELGDPRLPPSKTRHDPIFGDVEIYRGQIAVEIPVTRRANAPDVVTLKARSQGCADAGLCYPPQIQTVLVALDATANEPLPVDPQGGQETPKTVGAASNPQPAAKSGAFRQLTDSEPDPVASRLSDLEESLGLGEDDELLAPEEAFKFSAGVLDAHTLRLTWQIADATYLYKDKLTITIKGEGVKLGPYQLPKAKVKKDSVKPDGTLGDLPVYYGGIDFRIPLLRSNKAATDIELTARYQGCADRGICYPPQSNTLKLHLAAVDKASVISSTGGALAAKTKGPPLPTAASRDEPLPEQDRMAAVLAGGNTWLIIGSFFVIGLLLAFTPCVFPMIPILSGIIAGQAATITTRRAFILSAVYVLAMAVTYTVAGVLAGLFGANLQTAFQDPWIIGLFAVIFVALALSMFGFFELQLPSKLQSQLSELSNRQAGGTLVGVAIMGILSALIIGPCVAPPLAGALIYIGQTGDATLGGLALFAMSLGMGSPLVAIGTSAGRLLPRAGAWMENVKAVFGVLMLAVAIYLLERILPEGLTMLLWGALLVISGVYMGALKQLPVEAGGWHKLWQGLGLVILVYGAMFLVGAAAGGKDTVQPLRGVLVGGPGGATQHLAFKRIKTNADLDRELDAARRAGQPLMLDFYADWCVYCKQMEKNTFTDASVHAALASAVLLQADVTAQDEADLALQRRIGIPAPPALIFWDTSGAERHNFRLLGYMGPDAFADHVKRALQ